jgi:uncharacterized protein (DUF1697 family)
MAKIQNCRGQGVRRKNMTTYVAFFRGINVGGKMVLPMARLREAFVAAGFGNVKTVLNSGNVLFDTRLTQTDLLAKRITASVQEHADAAPPVMVVPLNDLRTALRDAQYVAKKADNGATHYLSFLSKAPPVLPALPLSSPQGDVEILAYKKYAVLSLGHAKDSRNGFPNAFIETTFKATATTRNLKTLTKIVTAETPENGG